jgi:TetR/AcrR family transcriptional regulator, transcriptional repressor for nem operon
MGRTRSYDEAAVLSGAMHLFRRKSYESVSIHDLEEATGLTCGSIYHSFGDKAGLFDAAFAHYNRAVLARRIEQFTPSRAGLRGLRELFLSLLHEPNGEAYGCLITNIAIERGGEGKSHPCVSEALEALRKSFAQGLEAARRTGTLRSNAPAAVIAAKLLALYQGVLVLVRAGYDKTVLKRLINTEFADLEVRHGA